VKVLNCKFRARAIGDVPYRDFAQGGQELAEEGQRAPIGTLPVFLIIKVELQHPMIRG
jgi:hypothetical protein